MSGRDFETMPAPASSTTPTQQLTTYPSRRALREAEAVEAAPLRRAERPARRQEPRRVQRAANGHEARRVERRARRSRPVTTAAPRPATRSASPWRALVTVLVVPGLFATAALPAYAATFEDGGGAVFASGGMSVGQSLTVSSSAAAAAIDRSGLSATSNEEMAARQADPGRAARVAAYDASGARELGDDYPWPYEAADVEGGGLSPLNYYYRECVDFVAWRLNRDAGSTSAPWKYTWSDLTPNGGDGSQWAAAWRSHGWPTGDVPVPGSVAWFAGNHVAYVKAVTEDGDVVIEEYNHGSTHKYGVRTIPASQVALFLYAPPR